MRQEKEEEIRQKGGIELSAGDARRTGRRARYVHVQIRQRKR